jgi:hypothetical protein
MTTLSGGEQKGQGAGMVFRILVSALRGHKTVFLEKSDDGRMSLWQV